jgi:hypothetical protein
VPLDPKLGEERHREFHPLLRLGDDHRPALEAAKPGALPTMMARDGRGGRLALHACVLGDDGGIGGPLVRAVALDIPVCQAIHHLLQGGLVTAPTCPGPQGAGGTIQGRPGPERPPFFCRECHSAARSKTLVCPVGAGFSSCSVAQSLLQLRTDWAETWRRHTMRCIAMLLRDHRPACIFIGSGFRRGVVRVTWEPHCGHGFVGLPPAAP